ncbi:LysR family transcriptional regulator [uncultured Sphaerochaeta sp.]|uniref:LysR family transcriptional regulator n=1 Tax=uncultured Sphaerochaeta sp. TaxID=886478 RepID=UPI002A0A1D1B|nr:LysR family transcriptional regulator [uncultured Sphaerochaeta sp.]
MTLRHIRIFNTVCDQGSTVKAAEALHISQPSVSLALKELEEHYGIKLFDRISRRLELTEQGKNFLTYARSIDDAFLSLETQVKDYGHTRQLGIGASITIAIFLLPSLLGQFKENHPETNLDIRVMDSTTIARLVVENKLDVGIIETPVHNDFLSVLPFYQDHLTLFVSSDHTFANQDQVSLAQLTSEQLILRESTSAGRKLIDSTFKAQGLECNHVWESVSYEAILAAVEENLGIAILPQSLIRLAKNRRIVQVPLSDALFARTYSIIHHKNKYLTEGARNFIDLCQKFGKEAK